MASLTGNTIQSTYDALLKVTDNGSITGSLKRITDGLGNNTPLYLSNSAAEFTSALNVTGAITGSNLSGTNTGDETNASIKSKLGAATGSNDGYLTSADWTTFMAKIAGSGTLNKLAKFSSSSSIADSTITDTGSAVTIGVATSVTGSLTASSIIKSGGTSSQFLKADGSIDSNSYALASSLSSYVPTSRTLTINGTAYDLSADRIWTISPSQWVTSGSNIYYNTGNVGIGTSSPLSILHTSGAGAVGQVYMDQYGTTGANILLRSARGTQSSPTAVQSGDLLGSIGVRGYGATAFSGGGRSGMYMYAAENFTDTAQGSFLLFGTTPVGNASRIERMRITDAGNVGIGTGNANLAGASIGLSLNSAGYSVFEINKNNGRAFYIYADDGQTFLGNFTSSPLIIRTADTERMRITSTGNVGIGTSSPGTKLDVVGIIRGAGSDYHTLSVADGTAQLRLERTGGSAGLMYIGADSGGFKIFDSGFATRFNVTSGGNVGIGTTSPQAPLQVVGTGVGGYGLIGARGENAHLGFRTAADVFKGWVGYFNSATHGSDVDLNIKTGYAGSSNIRLGVTGDSGEAMRITSGSDILFNGGDTSSQVSTATPKTFRFNNDYSNGSTDSSLKLYLFNSGSTRQGFTSGPAYDLQYHSSGDANGKHIWYVNNTERMRIVGGNVGIGTSSPVGKLHITGTSGSELLRLDAAINTRFAFKITGAANDVMTIYRDHVSVGLLDIMSLGFNGNVGIGTTSPGYKLDVNGNVNIGSLGSGSDAVLNFSTNASGAPRTIYYKASTAAINVTSTGGSDLMTITNGGNVGIGTSSPEALLHLNKSSAGGEGAFIFIDNPAASTLGNKAGIRFATNSGATFSGYGSYIEAVNTNAGDGAESLTFGTWNGSSRGERVRIAANGNVLIGTTSDIFNNAKLQVNGGMTYQNLFNRRTASYTLSISDQNYIVEMNVGSANNLTVPPNSSVAFPVGTEIAVLQYGAGQTTIVAGSGVSLKSKSNALKISGQYAGCTLVKVGTDEWYVVGDLTL